MARSWRPDHQRERRLFTFIGRNERADACARGEWLGALGARRRCCVHHVRPGPDIPHRCHDDWHGHECHESRGRRGAGFQRCRSLSGFRRLRRSDGGWPCAAVDHDRDAGSQQLDRQRSRFRIQLRHRGEHARLHQLRRHQFELSLPGIAAPVRHQFQRTRRRGRAEPIWQRPDRWRHDVPAERIRVQHFHDPRRAAHRGCGGDRAGPALPAISDGSTRLDATTQTVNIGNTNGGVLGTGGTVGVDAISLPTFPRPEVQLNAGNTVVVVSGGSSAVLGLRCARAIYS